MKILKNAPEIRIDSAILKTEPSFTRSKIQKMIEDGLILVNSKPVKPSYKVKTGDIIEIHEEETSKNDILPENIPLDIIFEDEHFLVINKQKGLLSHPTPQNRTGTLVNALLYHCSALSDIQGKERAGIVHRLDKNTSGIMMAAKTNEAHINLQKQIQEKTAKRKYLTVVYGNVENGGIIEKPLIHNIKNTVKMMVSDVGMDAITHYKVLKRYDGLTLLDVELKTGRTHQIRCHLASINHPVFGDTLYGAKGFRTKINFKTTEQLLMSYYLKLKHPVTGKEMEFELDFDRYDNDFKRFFKIMEEKPWKTIS